MIEAAALGAVLAVAYLAAAYVAFKVCGRIDRAFGGNAPPPRRRAPRGLFDRTVFIVGVVSAAAMILAIWMLLPRHARGAERGAIVVPCGDRAGAARLFAGRYGETPLLEGLTTNGARAELFAGRTRTWSFVVTDAEGRACLLAAGTALGPAITIEPEGETP